MVSIPCNNSFVTLCARAGVQQHIVQKLVGHGSPKITEGYDHHAYEKEKREAVAALPDIPT